MSNSKARWGQDGADATLEDFESTSRILNVADSALDGTGRNAAVEKNVDLCNGAAAASHAGGYVGGQAEYKWRIAPSCAHSLVIRAMRIADKPVFLPVGVAGAANHLQAKMQLDQWHLHE